MGEQSTGRRTGIVGLLVMLASKFSGLIFKFGGVLSKVLLKGGKVSKAALGLASVASYSYLFSPEFAVLLLFSIGFHELGHLFAMRHFGMETKGMYFIPLLGGAAVADEAFPSHKAEAYVALAGPIFGLVLALATFGVYQFVWEAKFVAAAAAWMAMVNLFNLLPVKPLDGGRVMSAITFSISGSLSVVLFTLLTVLTIGFALQFGIGLLLVLLPIGLIEIWLDFLRQANRVSIPTPWGSITVGSNKLDRNDPIDEQVATLETAAERRNKAVFDVADDYSEAFSEYAITHTTDDPDDVAAAVTRLDERFQRYDTHLWTSMRSIDGESIVVSIWETEAAAHEAAAEFSTVQGVTEAWRGDYDRVLVTDIVSEDTGADHEPETTRIQVNDDEYVSEDGFYERLDDDEYLATKPNLSIRQMAISVAGYLALVAALGAILLATQHVAGAEAAMNVLA
jgi:Zn-dependent protease